jgi:hypothetical protein
MMPKLFGIIPEPVFTFLPESCSRSTRNTVRHHPGIAFILPRIPHQEIETGLSALTDGAAHLLGGEPSGVIVHMTRCASTALANAMKLGERTVGLSEAGPVVDCMMASHLTL